MTVRESWEGRLGRSSCPSGPLVWEALAASARGRCLPLLCWRPCFRRGELEKRKHGRWTWGSCRPLQGRLEPFGWMVAGSKVLASKHGHCIRRLGPGHGACFFEICRAGRTADPSHPTDPFATLVQEFRGAIHSAETLSSFKLQ